MKLVEVDLHDVGGGVGKLDGLDVVVADAAKLVGKKAKVVVGRVLDGQAFATLVDSGTATDADHVRERGGEADTRGARAAQGRRGGRRSRPRAPSRTSSSPSRTTSEVEEAPVCR